ncbi:MAG: 4-alpha-glucanotransferase [Bradymonadales bacterium]|jgi:4-alpha-glucanotransferase
MRRSGVLLHPTSLPGIAGIGSIGAPAREFIDFLRSAQQQIWQMLPLVPIDDGGCPYNSTSALAYNVSLVDLADLCTSVFAKILSVDDLLDAPTPKDLAHADFGMARRYKAEKIKLAYERLISRKDKDCAALLAEYKLFCKTSSHWLDDFALFEALQTETQEPLWTNWPKGLRDRKKKDLVAAQKRLSNEIELIQFGQFLFYKQWKLLQLKAKSANISLMGDVPIFVSSNSVDVWVNREIFQLDEAGKSLKVAGVPPDYFTPEGQLWGNPLYDWEKLAKTDYAWWKSRLAALAELVDIIRIDHFRGFESFWEVDADAKTAIGGKWVKGPGIKFFNAMRKAFPKLEIVAEDLGINTPAVEKLRIDAGFSGMRVLQFGFPLDNANDHHAPHMHERDTVVYTGTHDNNTVVGWFNSLDHAAQDKVRRYLAIDGRDIAWQMIQCALSSVAELAIIPAQDLLSLGVQARMNVPGLADGNWTWRLEKALPAHIAHRLRDLSALYGRTPSRSTKS